MTQGGANAKLRAYGVGRIVSIGAPAPAGKPKKGGKGASAAVTKGKGRNEGKAVAAATAKDGQLTVQRFYRPEDVSRKVAYTAPFTDVYESEEHVIVDLDHVVAPCHVLAPGKALPGEMPT